MRSLLLLTLLALPLHAQSSFDIFGYAAGRALNATGPTSWLEGGWGRLEATGELDDVNAEVMAGIDWRPSRHFGLHVSGIARKYPEEFQGQEFGLIEAYADARMEPGLDEIRLRAGLFFLPTSRENIDPLWQSPYTINFSALNTWVGEEVRPVGVDLQWRHVMNRGHVLTTGATAFKGNDTMGTLVGWRGWSVGNRLTVYDEVLPLPPFEALETFFFRQRDDGSKPFGVDLDGNIGYSGRVRYSVPQRGSVQYTYVDNQGDRLLYRGEYAWATAYHQIGAELGNPDNFVVIGEYVTGSTGMGRTIFPAFVDLDFKAGYILVSDKRGKNRFSARFDKFSTTERDHTIADNNDEDGKSWTLTWLYDLYENVRLGAEFTQITGDRPEAARRNIPTSFTGRTFTLELRYLF